LGTFCGRAGVKASYDWPNYEAHEQNNTQCASVCIDEG
jgi:hypothetical protein